METQKNAPQVLLTINTNVIALTSIVLTVVSMLWNAFYGYGRLSERMDTIRDDIKEIKVNMEKMNEKMDKGFQEIRLELHKHDIRLTTLEQRKP